MINPRINIINGKTKYRKQRMGFAEKKSTTLLIGLENHAVGK